ncbi:biotin/lipoyl-binding protein [Candidatus Bipolaricaulota bacterium]|nr:biotin/lipoyl-binding protein [Candidatus Bipolaricaulota bacterium]
MDLEELQRIIALLKEEDLTEITVSDGEKTITVRRDVRARTPSAGEQAPERAEEQIAADDVITAPLLGTFYSRPNPDEEPFVSEGDVVSAGDTLCIIDAMKVMNEIKAEFSARIVEVLVEDGEPVQYGQPLFRFERA